MKALFSIYGFKQLIKKRTRVTENSSTIIDVILTNSPKNIIHTDLITTNLSDHEMIGAIRKKFKHNYQLRKVHSRNYTNYNKENVENHIKNINWGPLFMSKDPTNA